MENSEVFAQLLKYFFEQDDKLVYSNMLAYAEANLAAGNFALAEQYANGIINMDDDKAHVVAVRKIKLFIKLGCRSEEEFCHCDKFDEKMPEYMALLQECADDKAQLGRLSALINKNTQTVAADRAAAKAKEEADRVAREIAKKKEIKRKQKFRYNIILASTFLPLLIFLLFTIIVVFSPVKEVSFDSLFWSIFFGILIAAIIAVIAFIVYDNKKNGTPKLSNGSIALSVVAVVINTGILIPEIIFGFGGSIFCFLASFSTCLFTAIYVMKVSAKQCRWLYVLTLVLTLLFGAGSLITISVILINL